MQASEVLRRYGAGERDFSNANLCGQSFKGKDLTGANFSGADIRGTNFERAILEAANFAGAQAGVPLHWFLLQQLVGAFLTAVSGLMSAFSGLMLGISMSSNPIGIPFAILGAIASTIALSFVGSISFPLTLTLAVIVIVTGIAVVGMFASFGSIAANLTCFFGFAFVSYLISIYAGWRMFADDSRFNLIRRFNLTVSSWSGTRFYQSDLTDANFSQANLNGTNFRRATLKHVNWHAAQHLNRAKMDDSKYWTQAK